jgi:hypothetical protein
MGQACPTSVEAGRLQVYAAAIVRYSLEFDVDPWLLAALVYAQSGCDAEVDNSYGTGLTLIKGTSTRASIASAYGASRGGPAKSWT